MFDIFPDDIREALSDIFKILKKRNPTKIVTQFQGVINFGASSQADFILSYFKFPLKFSISSQPGWQAGTINLTFPSCDFLV